MNSSIIGRHATALLLLGLILVFSGCKKEEGCTDPAAINYNPEAEKDDGSCTYSEEIVIADDGSGTGTTTWSSDNVYILDGFVFVNPGQTLTIEPGTVIKGRAGTGANASALIVSRGATIIAEGTATDPIIFTAEGDDLNDPNDIPAGTRGLWGGLIVLGNAVLNSSPGVSNIEGIPITEPRGQYGGTDDNDNSGSLKYISVRYGGSDIGAGNEINGVTFGGVGSGTTVEYIEVFHSADDGFEFFGGTVNAKWLIAAFPGDDGFDTDEGYRGKLQFIVAIMDESEGDRGGEHDGGTNPEDGQPYSHPEIWNATYIGMPGNDQQVATFRDNSAGEYQNSLFIDFDKGIDIEMRDSGEHCFYQFQRGDIIIIENIYFYRDFIIIERKIIVLGIAPGSVITTSDSIDAVGDLQDYSAIAGNQVGIDPGLNIVRTPTGGLDLNPSNAAVNSGATPPTDPWFTPATYTGAFDGTTNWAEGWTALSSLGYF